MPVSQLADKRGDLNLLMDKVCRVWLSMEEKAGPLVLRWFGKETFQNIEVGVGLASQRESEGGFLDDKWGLPGGTWLKAGTGGSTRCWCVPVVKGQLCGG